MRQETSWGSDVLLHRTPFRSSQEATLSYLPRTHPFVSPTNPPFICHKPPFRFSHNPAHSFSPPFRLFHKTPLFCFSNKPPVRSPRLFVCSTSPSFRFSHEATLVVPLAFSFCSTNPPFRFSHDFVSPTKPPLGLFHKPAKSPCCCSQRDI